MTRTKPPAPTALQRGYTIAIRKVFRKRVGEIKAVLIKRRDKFKESFKMKESADKITMSLIENIMGKMLLDLDPITQSFIGTAFNKAAQKTFSNMKMDQWGMYNSRVSRTMQKESYKYLRKYVDKTNKSLLEYLREGIEKGEPIKDISKQIEKTFRLTSYKAELIARTEIVKTYSAATKDAIIRGGVTNRYEWVTSRKENVCPLCAPLHGKIFNVNDPNAEIPPKHPQCNCGIVPVVDI